MATLRALRNPVTIGIAARRSGVRDKRAIKPNEHLTVTNVVDSTPWLLRRYALTGQELLLACLRHNHLLNKFTGMTCYHLGSHVSIRVTRLGQVITDHLYVGINAKGVQYVFPLQAKAGKDRISPVQVQQDLIMCATKFPSLICRAIGAQFMQNNMIALFEFESTSQGIKVVSEKHYQLVSPEEVTPELLRTYRERLPESQCSETIRPFFGGERCHPTTGGCAGSNLTFI